MQVDATVFTCISMLSRAMGPSIQPDIKELLEPMLAVGLRYVHQAVVHRTDSTDNSPDCYVTPVAISTVPR